MKEWLKLTSATSKIKNHESSARNKNNGEHQPGWLRKKQATNHPVAAQYDANDNAGTKSGNRENFSPCNETMYQFLP